MAARPLLQRSSLLVLDRHAFHALPTLHLLVPPAPHQVGGVGDGWGGGRVSCGHVTSHRRSPHPHHRPFHQHRLQHSQRHQTQRQEVIVEWRGGVAFLRVPLPTSRQPCLFVVRPVANTVHHLLEMIKSQDPAVTLATCTSKDGCLIASSNRIEHLLAEDFKLTLNDKVYDVQVPLREQLSKEEEDRLGEIKSLVHNLYTVLNVEDHVAERERHLLDQLHQVKDKLEPLEKKKELLDEAAGRRTTAMTWAGLGLMSVQFGILARLTWWEYSWDIMEPVTYFVTYGTAMAAYAYFVLTKQEYLLPEVRDRQHLISVHKRAAKVGLDLTEYNRLRARLCLLEEALSRVREPRLPPPLPPATPAPDQPPTRPALLSWIRAKLHK